MLGDPLSLIALGIIIFGVILLVYGLIPFRTPDYVPIPNAVGTVPLSFPNGTYVTNPSAYFLSNYSKTPVPAQVQCVLENNGFQCFGYKFDGMTITYSNTSQYYGLGMLGLGAVGLLVARKFAPVPEKGPHLRPIRIRVDEDVCVANGVCIGIAPNVFSFKKQESPTLLAPMAYVTNPVGADNDTIIIAAQMCPTGAIVIEDAETGEIIHPSPPKN